MTWRIATRAARQLQFAWVESGNTPQIAHNQSLFVLIVNVSNNSGAECRCARHVASFFSPSHLIIHNVGFDRTCTAYVDSLNPMICDQMFKGSLDGFNVALQHLCQCLLAYHHGILRPHACD
ncbi:hypothetical protein NC77_07410 [Janthinobacterium lividum]|nr:hypothetical protein NC77_07410 [Janthinobacterium lividum]